VAVLTAGRNRLRRTFSIAVVLCSLRVMTSCNYAAVGTADIDVLARCARSTSCPVRPRA
jgi:hypothetical protein